MKLWAEWNNLNDTVWRGLNPGCDGHSSPQFIQFYVIIYWGFELVLIFANLWCCCIIDHGETFFLFNLYFKSYRNRSLIYRTEAYVTIQFRFHPVLLGIENFYSIKSVEKFCRTLSDMSHILFLSVWKNKMFYLTKLIFPNKYVWTIMQTCLKSRFYCKW